MAEMPMAKSPNPKPPKMIVGPSKSPTFIRSLLPTPGSVRTSRRRFGHPHRIAIQHGVNWTPSGACFFAAPAATSAAAMVLDAPAVGQGGARDRTPGASPTDGARTGVAACSAVPSHRAAKWRAPLASKTVAITLGRVRYLSSRQEPANGGANALRSRQRDHR